MSDRVTGQYILIFYYYNYSISHILAGGQEDRTQGFQP